MNEHTDTPEERDLELARRIGEKLEAGSIESSGEGRFFDGLLSFKRQASRDTPSPAASDRMWARIDEATRIHRLDRPAKTSTRTPQWAWMSLAAALVVGAIITLLVLRTPGPELLARAEGSVVEYTTADGSTVTLRPFSELYLIEAGSDGSRYRLDGEAFFDVVTQSTGTFSVESAGAVVEVLGTRFNLSSWGDGAAVFLEEGRVRFAHVATGDALVLEPGQASRLTASGQIVPASVEAAEEYVDWMAGSMVFTQRPAALIASEFEQHFAVSLDLPPALATETLSGRIALDDRVQALEDFAAAAGARLVHVESDRYRLESE